MKKLFVFSRGAANSCHFRSTFRFQPSFSPGDEGSRAASVESSKVHKNVRYQTNKWRYFHKNAVFSAGNLDIMGFLLLPNVQLLKRRGPRVGNGNLTCHSNTEVDGLSQKAVTRYA